MAGAGFATRVLRLYREDPGVKLRAEVSALPGAGARLRPVRHLLNASAAQAWRSRSALPITETELKAIAAPASMGLSNRPKNG